MTIDEQESVIYNLQTDFNFVMDEVKNYLIILIKEIKEIKELLKTSHNTQSANSEEKE